MAKRKAGVNDIIYELDNDDVEISSEDEGKESKIICLEENEPKNGSRSKTVSEGSCVEVVNIDCSDEHISLVSSPNKDEKMGGKSLLVAEVVNITSANDGSTVLNNESPGTEEPSTPRIAKTTIFDEDIVVDSPNSNSDPGVVGCQNKTPLVTVRFKDKRMAKTYKEKIKAFMINLIKLHEDENAVSDADTDLDLDIWPEDFSDDVKEKVEELDDLFFVDTDPCDQAIEVPRYRQNMGLISDIPVKVCTPPPVFKRGPICFNCDGDHSLRDCNVPRNNARISEARKQMTKVGRYHVEDDQKYGHLLPGRISGQLRHALGLKRSELPIHVYRMRQLGYPPGWLEEARISHSGITMFDSSGNAILDPEEEEGEVCEPGCKDKFDIKKILDFPGFNVPASSRYKDEAELYGLPMMGEQDSKMAMLQTLAPNAMKAYKRKKLTFFPSASANNSVQEGHAEMDIDSGDEQASFPSVPPLPDEAPPALPPPPPCPPPPLLAPPPTSPLAEKNDVAVKVSTVDDVPLPQDEVITIDVDEDNDDDVEILSQSDSGRVSPSLDDLEEKKKKLLSALLDNTSVDISLLDETIDDNKDSADNIDLCVETSTIDVSQESEIVEILPEKTANPSDDNKEVSSTENTSDPGYATSSNDQTNDLVLDNNLTNSTSNVPVNNISDKGRNKSDVDTQTTPKTGKVKTSSYGTPVINVASPFLKLPSDEKFAKDICDVINFENLPNSIGKYKKISSMLKKVKSEVDRIQES